MFNKTKNALKKGCKAVAASTAVVVAGIGSAVAAIPAVVGTTLTSVETDALAMIDLVWPIVLSIFGGLLLIKLFKRAGNKI